MNILKSLTKPALLLFFPVCFSANATLLLEGQYQGENLFIQLPSDNKVHHCATKVTVNGDLVPREYHASAFEIDLSYFNIPIGKEVTIIIEHSDECEPKVLNPEVLLPKSTFIATDISVSTAGYLAWETTNEKEKLPYIIEQYRWNRWIQVGEIPGKGKDTSGVNVYEFQTAPHSGENTLRVVQIDHTGTKRTSKEVRFISSEPPVEKVPMDVKNVVLFTSENQPVTTDYEIYDIYGNIIEKGDGDIVSFRNLPKGTYYLNFDNQTEKFIKE